MINVLYGIIWLGVSLSVVYAFLLLYCLIRYRNEPKNNHYYFNPYLEDKPPCPIIGCDGSCESKRYNR